MSSADGGREDRIGSGANPAPGAASWPGLAAAPTFALMALWTGFFGDRPDMICMGMDNASPLNGMALMYAFMTVFHAGPWLKLLGGRGCRRPSRTGRRQAREMRIPNPATLRLTFPPRG